MEALLDDYVSIEDLKKYERNYYEEQQKGPYFCLLIFFLMILNYIIL